MANLQRHQFAVLVRVDRDGLSLARESVLRSFGTNQKDLAKELLPKSHAEYLTQRVACVGILLRETVNYEPNLSCWLL